MPQQYLILTYIKKIRLHLSAQPNFNFSILQFFKASDQQQRVPYQPHCPRTS